MINFDGYNSFHSLRPSGVRGGGVSAFVSNKFTCTILHEFTAVLDFIETLFLKVSFGETSLVVGIVYRPPASDSNLFTDKLVSYIEYLRRVNSCDLVLCGDFNLDLLAYRNSSDSQNFMNNLSSLSLIPLISKPTRITDSSATLIDNIFLSNPSNFSAGTLLSDISDHFPIFVIVKSIFNDSVQGRSPTISYRVTCDGNLRQFGVAVGALDLNSLIGDCGACLLYTSPSPRDKRQSRMPSSA